MPLQADTTTAITKAGQSQAATEAVVVSLVGIAQEVNMTEVHAISEGGTPETFDVRVIISLRSTGVPEAIAEDLAKLFALTRGTR